jgi:tetratricopeptide (TPR) repeat protein
MGADDPDAVALQEARRFRAVGQKTEACQAYAAALLSDLGDFGRREALLQRGQCQQDERKWDEAIATYRQLLAQLPAGMGRESDFVYGQLGLAQCLFEKGDYSAALEAMRAVRGHRIHTFCGTCSMLIDRRQILRESVLHEYVKEYDGAVSGYLTLGTTAASLRLLALYDAANQLPTLLKLVERESKWFDAATRPYRRECQNGAACLPRESELYRTVHGMLDLRKLEMERNWRALLSVLEPPPVGGQWERPDHEARDAARLLARHPRETLPLLLQNVSKRPYYPYALGLTGRAEAVAALQGAVRTEKNYGQLLILIDALLAAGPAGAGRGRSPRDAVSGRAGERELEAPN